MTNQLKPDIATVQFLSKVWQRRESICFIAYKRLSEHHYVIYCNQNFDRSERVTGQSSHCAFMELKTTTFSRAMREYFGLDVRPITFGNRHQVNTRGQKKPLFCVLMTEEMRYVEFSDSDSPVPTRHTPRFVRHASGPPEITAETFSACAGEVSRVTSCVQALASRGFGNSFMDYSMVWTRQQGAEVAEATHEAPPEPEIYTNWHVPTLRQYIDYVIDHICNVESEDLDIMCWIAGDAKGFIHRRDMGLLLVPEKHIHPEMIRTMRAQRDRFSHFYVLEHRYREPQSWCWVLKDSTSVSTTIACHDFGNGSEFWYTGLAEKSSLTAAN